MTTSAYAYAWNNGWNFGVNAGAGSGKRATCPACLQSAAPAPARKPAAGGWLGVCAALDISPPAYVEIAAHHERPAPCLPPTTPGWLAGAASVNASTGSSHGTSSNFTSVNAQCT